MFCPKCGSILTLKTTGKKNVLGCGCGYIYREKKSFEIKEKVKEAKKVEVVDEEINVLPKIKAECPQCKHNEAYFWTLQTRAGDEPETKFLKCVKCKHTWRDYG